MVTVSGDSATTPSDGGAAARRFGKLLQHVDDTISLLDADGVLVETSGLYKPILGYPSEFWASRSIFDLLHPDDAERVMAMRESVLATPDAVVSGEFRVHAADGSYQPLVVHAVNRLDDPDVGAIVITSRNVATEKALLADLARARDEALAELDHRTRLIATVSHELRNPIHAMVGMAELLAAGDLPPNEAALAAGLLRHIESLGTVVDDLVIDTRQGSRSDAATVEHRPTSIRPLIDDVLAVGRLQAAAGGVHLVVDATIDPALPAAVLTDPARLRQVLVNLVGNAVKFTRAGTVTIGVSPAGDAGVRLAVRDTGVGIPPDELACVFDAFTTGSMGGSATGAGLGLAVVRQLVDLLGGAVEVHSEVGVGTEFVVTLPARPADVAESMVVAPLVVADPAVLVIDDDPIARSVTVTQLTRLGLQPAEADSGEAALAVLARGEGPDLVVLDVVLPGLDGFETVRRLRRLEGETGRRAVVMGITGAAGAEQRARALAAGFDDVLVKPVGLAMLGTVLSVWLGADAVGGGVGAPPVDRAVLGRLGEELGSETVVADLVSTFLRELYGRRTALTTAVEANDLAAARTLAHTLKSSARLLGATDLGEACKRMESALDVASLRTAHAVVLQASTVAARWLQNWLVDGRHTDEQLR